MKLLNGCRRLLQGSSKQQLAAVFIRAMSSETYTTLNVTQPREFVTQVELNRPDKRNAMNKEFWGEMRQCFNTLAKDSDCRAVVLSGAGKIFTAGLDVTDLGFIMELQDDPDTDVARKAFKLREILTDWQDSFSVIEKCNKPVIAAIHSACVGAGVDMTSACDIRYCTEDAWFQIKCNKPVIAAIHSACVGGGVDMTSACDIRYCTEDAWFQIKEMDLGLAADLGTLQRFPKIIGNDSHARELAFTARRFYAEEAKQMGFVSRILPDKEALLEAALDTGSLIASKSPVAMQGIKTSMLYSRDHSVAEGLNHVGVWNQGMVQSEDVVKAVMAMMAKTDPKFSKL